MVGSSNSDENTEKDKSSSVRTRLQKNAQQSTLKRNAAAVSTASGVSNAKKNKYKFDSPMITRNTVPKNVEIPKKVPLKDSTNVRNKVVQSKSKQLEKQDSVVSSEDTESESSGAEDVEDFETPSLVMASDEEIETALSIKASVKDAIDPKKKEHDLATFSKKAAVGTEDNDVNDDYGRRSPHDSEENGGNVSQNKNPPVNSSSTPTLAQQFDSCLKDFYSGDYHVYLALSNDDRFPSLSEFLFGGSTPIYHHLDDILNFTDDDIAKIQFAQYTKYRTFFQSDFKTNELFKMCLEDNDYSKKAPEPTGSLCESLSTSHTSSALLDSILDGTTRITASPDKLQDVCIALVDEIKILREKVNSQEKQLSDFKVQFVNFTRKSTEHINKLATNKRESTTQSVVQQMGECGVGSWFPTLKKPNDHHPRHDEYDVDQDTKLDGLQLGSLYKRHKETDLTKKKWWALIHSVELATQIHSRNLASLYKQTFVGNDYAMLRQFYGQRDNELGRTIGRYSIPSNLKHAAEDLAAFVSFVDKFDQAQNATEPEIVAAGIDPKDQDSRIRFQHWLGAKDRNSWLKKMKTMFENAYSYFRGTKTFKMLTNEYEIDDKSVSTRSSDPNHNQVDAHDDYHLQHLNFGQSM